MEREDLASVPLQLLRTEPPYERWHHVVNAGARLPACVRAGSVVAVRAGDADRHWSQIAAWMPRLRRAIPAVPVVLVVDSANAAGWLGHALRTARRGVRAILLDGEPIATALRRQLTDVANLGFSVVEWLGLVGAPLPSTVETLLCDIIERADAFDSVDALLRSRGSTWRKASLATTAVRLPGPGQWFSLSLGLRACLALQAHPDRSIHRYAALLGYEDASPLRRRILHLFGVKVGYVRPSDGSG